jgi:hypothetical protein
MFKLSASAVPATVEVPFPKRRLIAWETVTISVDERLAMLYPFG